GDFLAVDVVDDLAAPEKLCVGADPASGIEFPDAQDLDLLLEDDVPDRPQDPELQRDVDPDIAPQGLQLGRGVVFAWPQQLDAMDRIRRGLVMVAPADQHMPGLIMAKGGKHDDAALPIAPQIVIDDSRSPADGREDARHEQASWRSMIHST